MNYEVNRHYFRRYMRFIESRVPSAGYVERHHIYPRSMFPQKANEKSNIIALTAREHFIAHWMLHKAFGNQMTQAFMYMKTGCDQRYWKLNSRSYELLRADFGKLWSDKKTGKKMSEEARKNMSAGRAGIQLSDSHRAAIGDGNRGKQLSTERKAKISAAKKGVTPNRVMTDTYRALLQRPKEKVACSCCGKLVAVNLVNRWHNDNCKEKAFA